MTGSSVLLDTNIVIDFFKGDNKTVNILENTDNIFIATAVLAELYLGAYRSANKQKHLEQIKGFLNHCTVLSADSGTAENYAIVKTLLFQKGKPIPENDIWIAATSLQHNLPLFTRDKHFEEVDTINILA